MRKLINKQFAKNTLAVHAEGCVENSGTEFFEQKIQTQKNVQHVKHAPRRACIQVFKYSSSVYQNWQQLQFEKRSTSTAN